MNISKERRQQAMEIGMEAFWAAVAKSLPEISTGDLPPDAVIAFESACTASLNAWLDSNLPLHFEFNESLISNPYRSECNTSPCDPSRYGFERVSTGGGCLALCKDLPLGCRILITDMDGSGIPTEGDAVVLIGLYDGEGTEVAIREVSRSPV